MGIFEKSPDGGITDIIDKIRTQVQEYFAGLLGLALFRRKD